MDGNKEIWVGFSEGECNPKLIVEMFQGHYFRRWFGVRLRGE